MLISIGGVLVSFWLSLAIAWLSQGGDFASPDFWPGGWFYGLPLLLLSPLYVKLFEWLPARLWLRALVGAALTPIPLAALLLIMSGAGVAIETDSGLAFEWDVLIGLYGFWYAMYGVFLGAWAQFTSDR